MPPAHSRSDYVAPPTFMRIPSIGCLFHEWRCDHELPSASYASRPCSSRIPEQLLAWLIKLVRWADIQLQSHFTSPEI